MRRGTNATITLTVGNENMVLASWIYVTIQQGALQITKQGAYHVYEDEIGFGDETNQLVINLSQQETLSLGCESAQIQVRFFDSNHIAKATNIQKFEVLPILLEGEIEDGGT